LANGTSAWAIRETLVNLAHCHSELDAALPLDGFVVAAAIAEVRCRLPQGDSG